MSNIELLKKINALSDDEKIEINDFIDFLKQKSMKKNKHPKAGFLKNVFIIKEGFEDIPADFKDYV